jgi:uncharacterized membrane protein YraQ (UPF0718 family)/copper chaperone CopZ
MIMLMAVIDFVGFSYRCWTILCELSPWLLLGMFISGLLHVLLPKDFVRTRFQGFRGVVQSVLLGVPLPLCSCGVIPAGIGLKNDGASDGASIGFLISTPQTGVDSILVSASFFGWPFAIFKMVTAGITGLIGGWITDATNYEAGKNLSGEQSSDGAAAVGKASQSSDSRPSWGELIPHSIEILHSIWLWLLIGIAISALIETLGFESVLNRVNEAGLLASMILMLAISIPLYVCATASVPIAAALVQAGLPPAVALVFLMAGPATNLTTMGAIRSRFGFRVLAIYLSTLVLGSFLAAFLFDWVLSANVNGTGVHVHDHGSWWSVGSAIIVAALILQIAIKNIKRRFGRPMVGAAEIELSVKGMHCGSCANRIEAAVGRLDGVKKVLVSLDIDRVTVQGEVERAELVNLIKSLGFEVVE